jgi:MFS family permease
MSAEPAETGGLIDEKALLPLYRITFIGTLGYGIILTFLVFLVTDYGGNALVFGLIAATYPAFQLIGAPILGKWSDIHGRRKILLLSQIGTMFAWLIFLAALFLPVVPLASVDSALLGTFILTLALVVIFAGRALDGITGGNVSVANAYLADVIPEAMRNRRYGRMSIASNPGYILGPAIAGILGGTVYGAAPPVLAAFLISVSGTIIILVLLPESRPCTIEEYREMKSVRKIFGHEHVECYMVEGGRKITLRLHYVPFMLMLYFLIFLGFNIYYTAFPAFAAVTLEWSPAELGDLLFRHQRTDGIRAGTCSRPTRRPPPGSPADHRRKHRSRDPVPPPRPWLSAPDLSCYGILPLRKRCDVAIGSLNPLEIRRDDVPGIGSGNCNERGKPCEYCRPDCRRSVIHATRGDGLPRCRDDHLPRFLPFVHTAPGRKDHGPGR